MGAQLELGKLLIMTGLGKAQRSQRTSAHQVSKAPCAAKRGHHVLSEVLCGQLAINFISSKARSMIGLAA